jgi:hypothetical protein
MNKLANWMMRLYPVRWRARYGDEMNALLADTGADARVVTDLFKGGIRMQFSTWSFPKLALVLGLTGMLSGMAGSYLLRPAFESTAKLRIMPGERSSPPNIMQLNEILQQLTTEVLSRTSLSAMINSPQLQLYSDERQGQFLEDLIEEMKSNIGIRFVSLPGALGQRAVAFEIAFRYQDRLKAQGTVSAFIAEFMSVLQRRAMTIPASQGAGSLLVMSPPGLPASHRTPETSIAMLAGIVLGLLSASIWRVLQRTGFIARRFSIVALSFGFAGITGVILADNLNMMPYQYRSAALLQLTGGNMQQVLALKAEALSHQSLANIISNPRLRIYPYRPNALRLLKEHVNVMTFSDVGGTGVFSVSFDYRDRYEAQQTLQAILAQFADADRRLFMNPAPEQSFAPVVMDVLDNASLPAQPISPNRRNLALTGGIAGLIAATIIAIVRRRWKPEADIPLNAVQE